MRKYGSKIVIEGHDTISSRGRVCIKKDRIRFQMTKDIKLTVYTVLPACYKG